MGQRLRAENVSLRRAHAEAQKVWEKDESREDLYPGRKLTARKMMKVRTSPNEEAANEVLEKEETKQTGKEERSEEKAAEKRKKKLEGKEGNAKKRAEKRQKQEEAFAELLEEARPMLEAEIEKIVSGMPGMDKIENIPW
jgi:hypothetical protein